MKKIFQLIYSNKFFAFIMLLIQIAVLAAAYLWLEDYSTYFLSVNTILRVVLVIYEINREDEPSFKLTWVLLIALFPVFGGLFYLYTRGGFISRGMHTAYDKIQKKISQYLGSNENVIDEIRSCDENTAGFAKYLHTYGGSPAYKNTAVKYYPLGDNMFEDMKKELLKAEKFIFLEFFIINNQGRMWPEILDILKKKAREGVEIRVLYDGMGCMTTLPKNYPEQLRKFGIECEIFAPIQPLLSTYQNNRDHRKIMVIDGRVAFNGGINLADEYINAQERFGHWKDTGVMLTGEAAAGFTGMFLGMWNLAKGSEDDDYNKYISESAAYSMEADGFVIPFADSPLDNIYVGKRAYIDNLNNAKSYVHIMTPYLVIDNGIFEAMKYASHRGVDVKIILPHIPDKAYAFWLARTYYPELIRAGVKIYEYIPGFVHAKMSVADGNRAIVGTINHDYRSLYLHYECATYLYDVPAIMDIENDFDETLKKCTQITMKEYEHFNIFTKLIGKAIKIVAPLL
jgi:cardiolipin synthase